MYITKITSQDEALYSAATRVFKSLPSAMQLKIWSSHDDTLSAIREWEQAFEDQAGDNGWEQYPTIYLKEINNCKNYVLITPTSERVIYVETYKTERGSEVRIGRVEVAFPGKGSCRAAGQLLFNLVTRDILDDTPEVEVEGWIGEHESYPLSSAFTAKEYMRTQFNLSKDFYWAGDGWDRFVLHRSEELDRTKQVVLTVG